jgi:hypothetical protein
MVKRGYCATCQNTGEVDCRCGGDLCVCGDEVMICPACGGDYDDGDTFDDDTYENDTPQIPTRAIAAMRELAAKLQSWLIAKFYSRKELAPAVRAGLIAEMPKISPGGFRFVYRITSAGETWLAKRPRNA